MTQIQKIKWTPEKLALVEELAEQKLSVKDIAIKLVTSESAIRHIIHRLQITTTRPKLWWTQERIKQLEDLAETSKGTQEIAAILSVSKSKIHSACHRFKILLTPPHYLSDVEKSAKWRRLNPEKAARVNKENQHKRQRKNRLMTWAYTVLSHERRRGNLLDSTVTPKTVIELVVKQRNCCYLCGKSMVWTNVGGRYNGWHETTPSIDRINNEKILAITNIAIAHSGCNRLKGHLTLKELITYCQNIVERFKEKQD